METYIEAVASIQIDRRRALKTGKYPVKLVVYFKRKRVLYGTGISFFPEEWEKSGSHFRNETLKKKQKRLRKILDSANAVIDQLGENFTFDDFDLVYNGDDAKVFKKHAGIKDVYLNFEEYIEKLNSEGRIGTAKAYHSALQSFRKYIGQLEFRDVTISFLKNYECQMLADGRKRTTIGMYVRALRVILGVAKVEGVLTEKNYPFGKGKYLVPVGRNIKKALMAGDIARISSFPVCNRQQAWARDIWMFSFFCNGMNMVDIFNLRYENINGDILNFVRRKTLRTKKEDQTIEIYISATIREIINKWGNLSEGGYIFNVLSEDISQQQAYDATKTAVRKINYQLKKIGRRLFGMANLTTYVARHSWATILLQNGVSTAFISKGLGHSSLTTTEHYLGDFTLEKKKEVAGILLESLK